VCARRASPGRVVAPAPQRPRRRPMLRLAPLSAPALDLFWRDFFEPLARQVRRASARRRARRPRRVRLEVELLDARVLPSATILGSGLLDLSQATQAALVAQAPNQEVVAAPAAQEMPSVAVDPRDANHVVVAYMDYGLLATGYAGIGVAVSRDGGSSWQRTSIALPAGFAGGASNPTAVFDGQ